MKIKGYTLLETVIAMGLFSIVAALATGGFVTIVRLQRKTALMRETQQNARMAIEIIAKEARRAKEVQVTDGTIPVNSGPYLKLKINSASTYDYQIYLPATNQITLAGLQADGTPDPANINPLTTTSESIAENLNFEVIGNMLKINFTTRQLDDDAGIYESDETQIETSVILEGIASQTFSQNANLISTETNCFQDNVIKTFSNSVATPISFSYMFHVAHPGDPFYDHLHLSNVISSVNTGNNIKFLFYLGSAPNNLVANGTMQNLPQPATGYYQIKNSDPFALVIWDSQSPNNSIIAYFTEYGHVCRFEKNE